MNNNNTDQIRWRCRRGMLELDQLLHRFFDSEYHNLNDEEKRCFSELLELPDPQLYRWLISMETPSNKQVKSLINKIKQEK